MSKNNGMNDEEIVFGADSFFNKLKIFIIHIIISFISLSCRSPQKSLLKSSRASSRLGHTICHQQIGGCYRAIPEGKVKQKGQTRDPGGFLDATTLSILSSAFIAAAGLIT